MTSERTTFGRGSHPLGRPARLLRMLRRDERDGLAEVPDTVVRQDRLILKLQPVALRSRHVLVREHRMHPRHADRPGDVDRGDARVGVRAAHRLTPEHPGRLQIARVRELARDLRDAVDTRDDLADAAELELRDGRLAHDAASRTASKILA